jgi:hypothetical protein
MLAVLTTLIVMEITSSLGGVNSKAVTVIAILYVLGALVLPIARRSRAHEMTASPPADADGSAAALLHAGGYSLVDGPHRLDPANAAGERRRLRGPDGRLVDLIIYDE